MFYKNVRKQKHNFEIVTEQLLNFLHQIYSLETAFYKDTYCAFDSYKIADPKI